MQILDKKKCTYKTTVIYSDNVSFEKYRGLITIEQKLIYFLGPKLALAATHF